MAARDQTLGDYVEETPVRTGMAVFGLGRIGVIHVENILSLAPKGVDLLYCVDSDLERRRHVRRTLLWHSQTVLVGDEDADHVFADPRVDAVVIGTPTPTHEVLVIKALKAGKAVLCEKPVALEYDSIRRCYEAAGKLPLFCAFTRRFDPSYRAVRERILKGEVGQVHVFKACSRDSPRPPIEYLKISGGIFHDCAVHDLDLVCWMLEERPISVFAQTHAFQEDIKDLGDHDTVAITMKFPSGALAIIDLSRNAGTYGYDQRIEVFGSEGMIKTGDVTPLVVNTYNENGMQASKMCHSFDTRYAQAYKNELFHFLESFLGKQSVEVRATETLAVCRMADACEESSRTGAVVHMRWN